MAGNSKILPTAKSSAHPGMGLQINKTITWNHCTQIGMDGAVHRQAFKVLHTYRPALGGNKPRQKHAVRAAAFLGRSLEQRSCPAEGIM